MLRISIAITLGASIGMLTACPVSHSEPDPTHCSNNGGDSWCGEQHPDGSAPYCRVGTKMCDEAAGITDFDIDGCFAERPEDVCYSACGNGQSILDDPDCEGTVSGMSSSGGMTDSGSTTEDMPTTDGGMTTTTGVPGCMGNEDCTEAGLPFCGDDGECVSCDAMVDGDAACEGLSPAMPVCEGGECVQCDEDNATACIGQTPTCGAGNSCVACSEHSDCPESACHLDGPDVGACFDVADVIEVANAGELDAALAGLSGTDTAVIVLGAGEYGTSVGLANDVEVAFLSSSSSEISGAGAFDSVTVAGNAIAYFGGVQMAGNSNAGGVACSGTSIWLDDSEVRNNSQVGMDVSGGCAAHLRRSVVRSNAGGGIVVNGASFEISNSAISNNLGSTPGLQILNSTFEATYTTIVGNFASGATPDTMQCTNASGFVRNSVVSGEGEESISACEALAWDYSAVDTAGLGDTNDNVGAWSSEWFAMPDGGDYHLSTMGETEFMDIAQWQDGDPLTDIDGHAIPMVMPSFPGYDQP